MVCERYNHLLVRSVFVAWSGHGLGIGTINDPGAGFVLFWAGLPMCALALTDMATLVKVEGHRWAVEDGSETAKTELGLGHNETPSRHGWHRHVPLMMLAFARLAVLRRRAAEITSPPRKSCVGAAAALVRWSVREIRRVVAR